MSLDNLFNKTFSLQKKTLTTDAATGEQTVSWTIQKNGIPCRMESLDKASAAHKKLTLKYIKAQYVIYTAWIAADPLENRIEADGITYSITGTEDMGAEKRILRIYLERVR